MKKAKAKMAVKAKVMDKKKVKIKKGSGKKC